MYAGATSKLNCVVQTFSKKLKEENALGKFSKGSKRKRGNIEGCKANKTSLTVWHFVCFLQVPETQLLYLVFELEEAALRKEHERRKPAHSLN